MDHKQLRAFLTIAETGNMTRAAELLHLVPPAVSRQLRLLEESLGERLFLRERTGMALTEAGRRLLPYARRVMLELDRARAEVSGTGAEPAGIVTVGLLPSASDVLASRLASAVAKAYPRIRLRLAMAYAGTLQQWLEGGEIDVAVIYGTENVPNLQARSLLVEPLWVVGSAAAKLNPRRPVPLSSLAGRPMILPGGPLGIRVLLDHACAVSNVNLDVAVETNAMSVQKSLVLGGHGFTILPPIAFAEELRTQRLSAAPLSEPRITRTIQLGLPGNRPLGNHVRHVADLLAVSVKEAVQAKEWPHADWIGG